MAQQQLCEQLDSLIKITAGSKQTTQINCCCQIGEIAGSHPQDSIFLIRKVVKENQILHKNDKVIAMLANLNIFPGDQLWVRDSEIHENRDIADELADQKMEAQQAEEGFRGTLLTSNISSQVVYISTCIGINLPLVTNIGEQEISG